jgi:ribonuclease HI
VATDKASDWKRMRFKKNKVWMAVGPDGNPEAQNGKVRIRYQIDQDYEYWVRKENIFPLEGGSEAKPSPNRAPAKKRKLRPQKPAAEPPPETGQEIVIYTDGASSGNPGPSGIGVLMRYGSREKEISRYLGEATNNIAELEAIHTGLLAVKNRRVPVRLYTDSSYAYGLLVLGWKAKKNMDLVERIRRTVSEFADLSILKVKGHAGNEGNERADRLATSAITSGR